MHPDRKRVMGGKIRTAKPDRDGYSHVVLTANQKRKRYSVHELVLMAFVSERPEGMVSRHLDGNPKNNTPENLAWGTHLENMRDRKNHGKYALGENHPMAKLSDEMFFAVMNCGLSPKEASDRFGISRSHAHRLIRYSRIVYEQTGKRALGSSEQTRLLRLQESWLRNGLLRNTSHKEWTRDEPESFKL